MYFLAGPLSFIIRPIYNIIGNYGFTLIIVTILIRLLTIPLTLKSQKNMAKTQLIQPELTKLQERYKNDREKLSMEMNRLYKQYDVNPMGGCLPLLIQMFILFGFIGVIYHPFQYILQMSKGEISELAVALGQAKNTQEMSLWGLDGVKEYIVNMGLKPINFDFFGIDLTMTPSAHVREWTVWIFPVLATVATYYSGVITKKQQSTSGQSNANDQAQATSNMMTTMMPVMTAVFTFTMPIGMSLYWFVSTAVQLVQQLVMNKFVNEKMKEQISVKKQEIQEKKEQRHHKKH